MFGGGVKWPKPHHLHGFSPDVEPTDEAIGDDANRLGSRNLKGWLHGMKESIKDIFLGRHHARVDVGA